MFKEETQSDNDGVIGVEINATGLVIQFFNSMT